MKTTIHVSQFVSNHTGDYLICTRDDSWHEHIIADVPDPDIARFIVTACNAHDELVEALTRLVNVAEFDCVYHTASKQARAALAKAKGQS